MSGDYSVGLTRSFVLSGDRSTVSPVIETLGDALAFLEGSLGGVPWDEALTAARLSVVRAAETGSRADIADATVQFERYLWTQQLI
jgi:hypothetical protein